MIPQKILEMSGQKFRKIENSKILVEQLVQPMIVDI